MRKRCPHWDSMFYGCEELRCDLCNGTGWLPDPKDIPPHDGACKCPDCKKLEEIIKREGA